MWRNPDPACCTEDVIVAAEVLSSEEHFQQQGSILWVTWAEALQFGWKCENHEANITQLRRDLQSETMKNVFPLERPAWRRLGWCQDVCSRATQMVKSHGFSILNGSTQQVKNTVTHGVFRVRVSRDKPTTLTALQALKGMDDKVFVSACLPNASEPRIVDGICSHVCKDITLPVVGIDTANHLIRQIGAFTGFDVEPTLIMDNLARMQKGSVPVVAELEGCGVPHRGLPWMSSSLETIFQRRALPSMSHHILRIRGQARCIENLCSRLLSYGFPHTLVHGNLRVEDVYGSSGVEQKVFLTNWTFCGISHPLFDYLHITEDGFQAIDDEGAKDHYIRFWDTYGLSKESFIKAIDIARPLMYLYKLYAFLHIYEDVEADEQEDITDEAESLVRAISGTIDRALGLTSAKNVCVVYDFILPSPDGSCILACVSNGQQHLPKASLSEGYSGTDSWETVLEGLALNLASEVGINAVILGPARGCTRPVDAGKESVLVTDTLDTWSINGDGMAWVNVQEALSSTWMAISEGMDPVELLEAYLDARTAHATEAVPWRNEQFPKEVVAWVQDAPRAQHMRLVGHLRQVRNTRSASVMKGDTRLMNDLESQTQRIYVKTVSAGSAEARLSRFLSSMLPDLVPTVLAINISINTFIQRDGGRCSPGPLDARLVARTIAEFQKLFVDHVDELKAHGACLYGLESTKGMVQTSLGSSLLDYLNNDDTVAELRKRIPEILSYCDDLFASEMPCTLVHGDLHEDNIGGLNKKGRYQILDWGGAFLGHPFCDFAVFCAMSDLSAAERSAAEEVYFSSWKEYDSRPDLARTSRLALIVYWAINTCTIIQTTESSDDSTERGTLLSLNTSITLLKGSMDEHYACDA